MNRCVRAAVAALVISLVIVVVALRVTLGLSKIFYVIGGIALSALTIILLCLVIDHVADRRHRSRCQNALSDDNHQIRLEYSFFRKVAGLPKKFTVKELEAATDNFKILLGRGSSASVYKGVLPDGTEVAVKRIDGSDHGRQEFEAEVAAIANVNHVNLVRLLGFCAQGAHRILVYEFVANGNLGTWIFPHKRGAGHVLEWPHRFRIAVGVAKALAYLHHDCRARILHLDVKPENILLDGGFEPKVSDFGLSRLMGREESKVMATVRGTRGYLAPEWLLDQGINLKSDVYSFGMVVLELIGGRRNVSQGGDAEARGGGSKGWSYFPSTVMKKAREGRLMEIVDGRLERRRVDEGQVLLLVKVAIWCIQEKSRLRPPMNKVVDMLEGRCGVEDPPETKMIIVDLLNLDQETSAGIGEMESGRRVRMEEEGAQNVRINFSSISYSYTMSEVSAR